MHCMEWTDTQLILRAKYVLILWYVIVYFILMFVFSVFISIYSLVSPTLLLLDDLVIQY